MGGHGGRLSPLEQALRWLARREYSVAELRRRLEGKGHPAAQVAEAVADLRERGLVSDRRFAESLARNRIERGYGPLRIAHDLRARGVDDAVVEEALEDDPGVWLERLEAFWRKRFGAPPQSYREWARQARALQARGFSAEQVRRVLPDIDA